MVTQLIESQNPKYLIVNADDYGYFSCVSRGILDGARNGAITATGIMANSPNFNQQVEQLLAADELDKGIHLNISYGRPLTSQLQKRFIQWNGQFPDKSIMARKILTNQIPVAEIENEWRTQIERCIDANIPIQFLNSHEHLHMLPPLYRIFIKLTGEYNLIYSRYSAPEWTLPMSIGATIRNVSLLILHGFNARQANKKAPKLLGMNQSGKLSLCYFKKAFLALKPGIVYELMCHPGHFDSTEIQDPKLLAYHDWTAELDVITSDNFKSLCESQNIQLVRYRDLDALI